MDEIRDTTSNARARWETITPERARDLLEDNTGNRNIRARAVDAYARDILAGRWITSGDTVKIAATGEVIDGQHRLHAIANTGVTLTLLIVRGLPLEARSVIDTGAARTGGDALRLAGITGGHADCLAAAARMLTLWQNGNLTHMTTAVRGRDRVTHSELLDTVKRNPDLPDAVRESQRDLARIGIPGGPQAMTRVVLFGVDARAARTFFDSLAGYSTDGLNDPRAALLHTVRTLRATGQLRRPGESIGLTFAAWNAWRSDRTLSSIPYKGRDGKPLPIPNPL